MSKEEYSEYARYMSRASIMTTINTAVASIALILVLFLADTTNGIVGIVLFLLYVSMMLFSFVTGEFVAGAFIYTRPKPEATNRIKVTNALFLAAILLLQVGGAFLFMVKNLVYHFAVAITLTVIVYGAMVGYTFLTMWKHR